MKMEKLLKLTIQHKLSKCKFNLQCMMLFKMQLN